MKLKLIHKLNNTLIDAEPTLSIQKLKEIAAEFSGIEMNFLRLLFRGRPCEDESTVEQMGMKDGSKIMITRSISTNPPSSEVSSNDPSLQTILRVEKEVDEIESQVQKRNNESCNSQEQPNPTMLMELLTQKLLGLDDLEVSGDTRTRRKSLINRIHDLCAQLEKTATENV